MSGAKEQSKQGRVRYSQVFKDDAVNLAAEMGSVKKAAERLGGTAQSLKLRLQNIVTMTSVSQPLRLRISAFVKSATSSKKRLKF